MKKRLFVLLVSIVLIFGVIPTVTARGMDIDTSWYSSSSTSFTITTASQLAGLANLVNAGNDFIGKTITLGNNINLNSEAWTPIGTNSTPFKGTFDGQGYTVQNLNVNGYTYAGFFGYADGSAVIKNVMITGSVSGTRYAGGIVGYIDSGVTVENCTNTGTVANSGTSCRTGGVVGFIYGTVSNCTNTGTVASDSSGGLTGGVVGYNRGKVSNCSNTGDVSNSSSGAYYTGGIVGHSYSGTVSNCYNKGAVSGGASIGGIVGDNEEGTVSNCYNTGSVSSGNYNGSTDTGGVVGTNIANGTVSNSYNIGTVSGGDRTGGVVGRNYLGTVSNCYNIGSVSGGTNTGGVAGENRTGCSVTNCYYLTGAATAAIGVDNGTSTSVAVKTSNQFASGEVAYLLNGNVSGGTTWYQNIDNGETMDDYPVLDNSHGTVYCTMVCDVCYSNNNVGSVIHVGYDAYGFCTNCGGYQPATLNTNGVYEISNAGQLFWFASLVNGDTTQEGITAAVPDACAVLTSNIDLSVITSTHTSIEWTPIGSKRTPFSGTFDGGGCTVSGMSITTTSDYMGLFGYVTGTVKNMTVSGSINVSGSEMYAGGIVGTVYDGTLSGLTSTVTINGVDDTMGTFGGIVATAEGTSGSGSTVERCTYSGSLTASGVLDCIGGIVGYINVATINDCLNSGTVDTTGGTSGKSVTTGIYTSGIVGYCNNTDAVITNCLNLGTISDAGSNTGVKCYTGAIIGRINSKIGSLSNCYYLSGTAGAGCGINGSSVDVDSNIAVKTADELASGEVAYLLNGSVSGGTTWYQNLDNGKTVDNYPVLSSSSGKVYYGANCAGTAIYSNSPVSVIHVGGSYDSNGFCTGCSYGYQPAALNSEGVYEISNAGQLFWFASLVNGDTAQENITVAVSDACAVLTGNIDLSVKTTTHTDTEWTPIGTDSAPYTGTFDGSGYEISGLNITTAADYVGLFGYVTGTVRNLTVSGDINVSGNTMYVGGIVGTVKNGTLQGLTSYVNVTVYDSKKGVAGGVVAAAEGDDGTAGSAVERCAYFGTLKASGVLDCIGGIVGYMNAATINNCMNHGTVDTTGGTAASSAGIYTGGIVSYCNNANAVVTNCYNYGTIAGAGSNTGDTCYTGAVIGRINKYVKEVSNCYYLESSLDGIAANGSSVTVDVSEKTAAEFASGEVAYLLNGSTSAGNIVWYQNLDNGETVDSYPVLDSSHGTVYYGTNCAGTAIYSNSTVPAAEHSWDEGTVTTEATCTGNGVKTYTCTICGETSTETIAATGHSYEAVVTEPTCTEKGYTTYTCTVCGDSYTADETEVTGHSYEAVVTEPTCTEKGYTTYTCTVCGDSYVGNETEAMGHSWDSGVVTKAATCTENGVTTYTCTVCGETRTEEIAATGHSWGETVYNWNDAGKFCKATRTCENDGSHVEEATATVTSKQTKAATCTEKGETTYTAVFSESWASNQTKVVADIEATGHSYDEPDWSWAADYSTATATFTCGTCSHTEQVTVNSSSETTAAICTEGGKIVYTATVTFEGLSYSAKETVELSAPGHTPGEAVKENEVAATCTEAGSFDSVVYCAVCGDEISRETIVVPATGHTVGEAVIENSVEATCTKDGSYDTVVYCTVCGDEISRETTVVPATGHTAGEAVIENKKEATCTEAGSYDTVIYCTECGAEINRETTVVPATGHSYGEWEEIASPTCEDHGSERHTCTVCGYVETRYVDATGHDWEDGFTVDQEPTCTTDGSRSIHCKNCDAVKDSETIPATGHTAGEAVIENKVEATCTEVGSYDTVVYCKVCGDEVSRVTTTVPALGHTAGEAVIENKVEATCTEAGSYDTVVYCTVCGEEVSRVTTTVPATGHDFGEVTYTWSSDGSTCTATRICKTDTSHAEQATATVTGAETKAATCTEKGETTYTAVFAEEWAKTQTKTIADIPELGHDFSGSFDAWDENGHWHICNRDGCTATDEPEAHSFTNYVYDEGTATWTSEGTETAICDADGCGHTHIRTADGSMLPDDTAPTGEITVGINRFKDFINTITFGIFCKDKYDVMITAEDGETGIASIEYLLSETEISEADITSAEGWKTYEGKFAIEDEGKYIIYAKVTDKAGNIVYISTDGLVVDRTNPEISGIEDGGIYCGAVEAGVYDEYLATVTVDGVEQTLTDGKFTVYPAEKEQTITVMDRAGNSVSYTVTVRAEHTWDSGEVTKAATCTEAGEMTYTCTICGETKTETIPALGHTAGDAVIENEVEATCTEEGSYDVVTYCTVCGKELSRETVTIPATGHTASEVVIENEVEATCTEEGSYDVVTYCTVCGEEVSRETMTIPALGHTAGEAVIENEVEATCTEDGSYDIVTYCTVCGEELSRETVTVSAVGHSYGEPVWNWNSDHTEAWAVFTCEHDATHTETVTAEITIIESEPEILYTATVTFDGQTWKDERTVAQEETTTEETTTPEETTASEETTISEETTVSDETTTPEQTTAADETTTVEETTATSTNAEEETTATGGSSSVTGDISAGIWIMILFVSGTLVVCTLWFGKKREEA